MREDQRHLGSKKQNWTIKQKWIFGETTQIAPRQISIKFVLNAYLPPLPGHNASWSSLNTKWQSVAKRQDKTQSEETKQASEPHSYMMRMQNYSVSVTAGRYTKWYTLEDSWHKLNIIFPYEQIIILLGTYHV